MLVRRFAEELASVVGVEVATDDIEHDVEASSITSVPSNREEDGRAGFVVCRNRDVDDVVEDAVEDLAELDAIRFDHRPLGKTSRIEGDATTRRAFSSLLDRRVDELTTIEPLRTKWPGRLLRFGGLFEACELRRRRSANRLARGEQIPFGDASRRSPEKAEVATSRLGTPSVRRGSGNDAGGAERDHELESGAFATRGDEDALRQFALPVIRTAFFRAQRADERRPSVHRTFDAFIERFGRRGDITRVELHHGVGATQLNALLAREAALGQQAERLLFPAEVFGKSREERDELAAELRLKTRDGAVDPLEDVRAALGKLRPFRDDASEDPFFPLATRQRVLSFGELREELCDAFERLAESRVRTWDLLDFLKKQLARFIALRTNRRDGRPARLFDAAHLGSRQLADLSDFLRDTTSIVVRLDTTSCENAGEWSSSDDDRGGEVEEPHVAARARKRRRGDR